MEDFKIFQILDVIDKFTILVECGAIEKPYLSTRCDQRRISIAVFRFTEGFDTKDLIEAKALLDELS